MSDAECIPLRAAGGPASWLPAQIDLNAHRHELTEAERDELDSAVRHAAASFWNPAQSGVPPFPLPALASTLAKWRHVLENGSGLFIIHGIPVDRYSPHERALLLCGIGAHLGRVMAQNAQGELLNHVRATPGATSRGYQTGGALPFHSDPCDLVGLLCLRAASCGGDSAIASAHAIHDALVDHQPDLLHTLYQPFHIERHDEDPPFYATPVFTWHAGRLFSRFNPGYVFSAQRHLQTPRLTPTQFHALETVGQLCQADMFRLDVQLEPGDLQFLNNNSLLHSRTAYEDAADPSLHRHLLRLWLCTREEQQLPPPMRDRFRDMMRWQASACLPAEDTACG